MRSRKACAVEECPNWSRCHGYCWKHYQRWKRWGDPSVIGKGGHKIPAEQRFWERTEVRTPEDCWEWTHRRTHQGYGVIWVDGRNVGAHRLSFFIAHGRWPNGLVCHHCDNPPCVNPAHLFEGDNGDNMRDAVSKGRWRSQHLNKANCIHGHPLSGDNLRVDKYGTRHCRACARRRNREWEARRRVH